jgi:diguanylate cyclase (GGDEF)-like protein/PAS domain S-box-containing protein
MEAAHEENLADYARNVESFDSRTPAYALYLLDTTGRVMTWNAVAERLTGYTAQEIVGTHFSVFYLPEERAIDKPSRALEIASREGTFQDEGLRERKDGTRFSATITITAQRDKDGKLHAFIKLMRDITEFKANEAALQEREGKYRALYEHSDHAIFLTRPEDGAILSVNPAACNLFGYSEPELTSLRREHVLEMTDPKLSVAWTQRIKFGAAVAELTFIRKSGQRFNAWVASRLFKDERGQQLACTSILDITERRQAEEALRRSEERFRLLYENAPVGIIHIDENAHLTSANEKFSEISGYSPEEAIGLTNSDITMPEDRETARGIVEDLLSGKREVINREKRLLRKDGSTIWVRMTTKIIRNPLGKPQWGIVVFEDITERKQAEEALRQSEEKFRATFERAPIGIAECAVDGKIIEANSKLADILGYTKDELAHLTVAELSHPGDMEKTLSNIQKLAAGEADSYVMEKRYLRKDRSYVWVNITASLSTIHGRQPYEIVTIEDITARKRAEEELKRAMEWSYHQANHDMLTGLANRASFNDRLSEALIYAKRDGHLVALHLLDLDGFKSINDTLGHHTGDLLLQEVAKRIKSTVRASDLVARLGGDEFVVIQTHLAEPIAAAVLAAKLVEELGRKYVLEGQEVHSGTSLGIAFYPSDADDPEELIKQADLALYDAKNRGRFNYQFYRAELGAAFLDAQRVEQELVRALRENEFCLHYQPQFDLKSGRITGIEALLRWCHPARGILAAGEFIQVAERARLMPTIGEWTLQTACRQYKEWVDSGLSVPLTLNLSSMQLRDPRFLQLINRILEETELSPPLLQLEMRESVLWDPKFSTSVLKQMKKIGLRLSLEEFGTELTALSTLVRFPLDAVKPGHGLVRDLASQGREATTVLAAIIGVAHNLKIEVCADGVETENQLAAVKEQGCDSAQGHLLSSPLDADEMKRVIEAQLAPG